MLEMLVVIFVFLTGIVGVYSVINNFYATSVNSTNRITALYLSQEGVELVRNLRDNNLLSPSIPPWNYGISDGTYQIDYDDTFLSSYADAWLMRNPDGLYYYGTGEKTIFKRKITIVGVNNANGQLDHINVKVETEWYKGAVESGSQIVESQLYEYWQ